jgi:REP element-mobilizing transposase RayT
MNSARMTDKPKYNPNIHHRRSIRLKGYDYSSEGLYFITICCHNKVCLFGHVLNGAMVLNEYGQIAFNEWMKTPEIRPNVELGEFIVMPNHIHGIIRITRRGESYSPNSGGESHSPDCRGDSRGVLNTPDFMGESVSPQRYSPRLQGPSQTIGAIVRGYKSAVTKKLNALGVGRKVWQRDYYEHIIRNEQAYNNISNYIVNNPSKWWDDKFYLK